MKKEFIRNESARDPTKKVGQCFGQNKLRLFGTPRCRFGLEEETGIHLICNYPKFRMLRHGALRAPSDTVAVGPDAWDIRSVAIFLELLPKRFRYTNFILIDRTSSVQAAYFWEVSQTVILLDSREHNIFDL